MPRIKIDIPDRFIFHTRIPVRITDINYSGHAGNDTLLSLVHETRQQFFASLGYSELNLGGVGTIMADAGIEYKKELFYGDLVLASLAVGGFTRVGFDLYYKLEKEEQNKKILVARVKTGIVCFDYQNKKIKPVPESVIHTLTAGD